MNGRGAVRAGMVAVVLAVAVAAIAAIAAFVVLRDRAAAPAAEVATPPAVPTLLRAVDLRTGPGESLPVVRPLDAGTVLTLVGRSADARWLVVAPAGAPDAIGWVPVAAVGGAGDVASLGVVAASDGAAAMSPATAAPAAGSAVTSTGTGAAADRADLVVERIFARANRLGVTIANRGGTDVTAQILVSVDGGTPEPVPVKTGEPLRAGEDVDFVFPDAYVQRPEEVRVTVSTAPPILERTLANNTLTAVVSPDQPNDLEVLAVHDAGADGHLEVVIRNDSPIPLHGPASLTVSTTEGASHVLGTESVTLDVAAGGTQTVAFPALLHVDFTRAAVRLATSAIDDAVPANDVYPR